MENQPQFSIQPTDNKSPFKIVASILTVVVLGLVSLSTVLLVKVVNNDNATNKPDGETSSGGNNIQGSTDEVSDNTVAMMTYSSQLTGLSFDYPSDWTLAGGENPNPYSPGPVDIQTITSPTGIRLEFSAYYPELGGVCQYENAFITKEGLPKSHFVGLPPTNNSINVVSFTLNDTFFIALSDLTPNSVKNIDDCTYGYLIIHLRDIEPGSYDFTSPTGLSFMYKGAPITNQADRKTVVNILSSLRKN